MNFNELLLNYFKSLHIMGIISLSQLYSLIGSSMLAVIGLMYNDFSAVIGAMLISPMGGPVRYAALAISKGKYNLIYSCILMLILMIIVAFSIGYIMAMLNNSYLQWLELPSKDMKKLSDSMFLKVNFLLGCVSGFITPYAMKHNDIIILAGTYIALSILPPIVNSGMYYRLAHDTDDAELVQQYKQLSKNSFTITLANLFGLGICSIIGFSIVYANEK
jgi:uncharacterized hydrophobic protein (TIGR00271 family)